MRAREIVEALASARAQAQVGVGVRMWAWFEGAWFEGLGEDIGVGLVKGVAEA